MIGSVLRVFFGFIVACLAAGLTMALFVHTPAEIVAERAGDLVAETLLLSVLAAIQIAIFAASFALIGAAFGEWQRIGSWLYYVTVAFAIACIGFLAQLWSETSAQPTIANRYAATAFAVTGVVSGLVYWLCAGRFAAGDAGVGKQEIIPPPASQLQAEKPESPSARVATWKTAT
jgi:hypothetical protein